MTLHWVNAASAILLAALSCLCVAETSPLRAAETTAADPSAQIARGRTLFISYEANGKQYIAVVTGFPSMVSEGYPAMFGPPYTTMEQNTGALIVYTLE